MELIFNRWLSSIRKYFFTFRDGFYEIPFLANSPEVIVKSFANTPFFKDDPKKGCFSTNNLFMQGEGHYHKIEEGLWIIMSNVEIKKDLSFKLYYEKDLPADYHCLTLYLNRGSQSIKMPKVQMDIDNQDRSWTLFKAGAICLNSHFKGQQSIFLSLYFSKQWVRNNMEAGGALKNEFLEEFFKSEEGHLLMPNLLENKKEVYQHIVDSILDKDDNGVKNLLLLKSRTYEILASFVDSLGKETFTVVTQSVSERDKRRVLTAQHLLNNAIFDKFPTIAEISKYVGTSETKIKADFKALNGVSMYQYYSQKQMTYAHELLKKQDISIKEVALSLGYSNQSKFAQAYKKQYGYLPSVTEKILDLA